MTNDLKKPLQLSDAKIGKVYKIIKVTCKGFVKKRLSDFGIIPGMTVKVMNRAPLGDPLELQVRGYPISLRANEASCVLVEEVPEK